MPLPNFFRLKKGDIYGKATGVDPAEKTQVKDSQLYSKCGWSPFSHLTFTNSIETTIVSGKIAYHLGELNMDCRGQRAEFSEERR